MNKIITFSEISEKTGVPIATLRYWRNRNNGSGPPTFRLGGRVRAYESEVDDWIATQASTDRSRRSITERA